MTKPPKAPAPEKAPEPSAFDRMRDLTRRIVNVPKSELPRPGASHRVPPPVGPRRRNPERVELD